MIGSLFDFQWPELPEETAPEVRQDMPYADKSRRNFRTRRQRYRRMIQGRQRRQNAAVPAAVAAFNIADGDVPKAIAWLQRCLLHEGQDPEPIKAAIEQLVSLAGLKKIQEATTTKVRRKACKVAA